MISPLCPVFREEVGGTQPPTLALVAARVPGGSISQYISFPGGSKDIFFSQ